MKGKRTKKFRPTFKLSKCCPQDDENDLMIGLINKDKKSLSHIGGNIFVSGMNVVNAANLEKHGIKILINCAGEEIGEIIRNRLSEYDYKMFNLNLEDNKYGDIKTAIYTSVNIIQEYVGTVLLFCQAGVSRSPSVAIGYYILVHKLSFDEAFNKVKCKRACTDPNGIFMQYLQGLG